MTSKKYGNINISVNKVYVVSDLFCMVINFMLMFHGLLFLNFMYILYGYSTLTFVSFVCF